MKKVIVIFIAAAFAVSACAPKVQQEKAPRVVSVEVMTVQNVQNAASASYVGTIQPSKSVILTASYPGTLTSVLPQGAQVGLGAQVAQIDAQSVKSSLEMSAAKLAQAQDGYDRLKQLYETGTVADVKMVEIETALAQAQAAYDAALSASEQCSIKAPFAGVISEVYAQQGVSLALAEPIARLIDAGALEVSIAVPESEISSIKVGAKALVDIPAIEASVEAQVVKKGYNASKLSHSYECVLQVRGRADGLMPGMVSKVRFTSMAAEAIVVPASAVKVGEKGRYIWVVQDGKAYRRDVQVGGFSGDGVVVIEGLSQGDTIITKGAQKVSSGMTVVAYERE